MNFEIVRKNRLVDSKIVESYVVRKKIGIFYSYYYDSENIIAKRNYSLSSMYAIFSIVGCLTSLLSLWFLIPMPIMFLLSFLTEKQTCTSFNNLNKAEEVRDNLLKMYICSDVVVNSVKLQNGSLEIKNLQ